MLYHCVYFWLKPELTAEQRADFRRGVETLKAIKSAAQVIVGAPAATTRRPVVDSSYDVALIVVCRDVVAEAASGGPGAPRLHREFQNLLGARSDLRLGVSRLRRRLGDVR